MKGLRAASYFYSRYLFRGGTGERGKFRINGTNHALRWMSDITPCPASPVPQTKESPRDVAEFGQVTLKKKPILASGLADLADRSPILQKLMDLGVEIHKFDANWNLCKFILSLDFERNIEPYLSFLREQGVANENLGRYLTDNPYILQCDLDDLQVRINYLQSKSFTKHMIAQIISGNPRWLSYEVKSIDTKLGDLQKLLRLSGNDVRSIVLTYPKIVNVSEERLHVNILMLKEQLELNYNDVKKIVMKKPILLSRDTNKVLKTFYYLQNEMNIPIHLVIEQPEILLRKTHILSIRHRFLVKLGRAQYDPKQPGYVSLENFCTLDDDSFCQTIAKTTLEMFHDFQKTL